MVRGNIGTDERVSVLVNYKDSLRAQAKLVKRKQAALVEEQEKQLMSKLISVATSSIDEDFGFYSRLDRMFENEFLQQNWAAPKIAESQIVYHLCGFLVKKSLKLFKCDDCYKTICCSSPTPQPEANFTNLLDIGGLHHPSTDFFNIILLHVEPVFDNMIRQGNLYGDILLCAIQELGSIDVTSFRL